MTTLYLVSRDCPHESSAQFSFYKNITAGANFLCVRQTGVLSHTSVEALTAYWCGIFKSGDAVMATSAKHMCNVCAAGSVSSAVAQRSQRTQIRALYFVRYPSLPSLFNATPGDGRIQWSLYVPIIFMAIPLWHSCPSSHRSHDLLCIGESRVASTKPQS